MSENPPPYNPNPATGWQNPYPNQQMPYTHQPTPYSHQPAPYPQPPPPYDYKPLPPPTNRTVVTGAPLPGGSTHIITSGQSYGTIPVNGPRIVVQSDVILVGGCPACRVGVLDEEFSLAGLCCAFWFFPVGILCCLAMRKRRCTNCYATFST